MSKNVLLAAIAALAAATGPTRADAIELADATEGAPVVDRRLSIGAKTLNLPSGDWTLVARETSLAGRINGQGARSERLVGLAIRHDDASGSVVAVLLNSLQRPTSSNAWAQTPCDATAGVVHHELLDSNPQRPACLVIRRASGFADGAGTAPYEKAAAWVAARGLPPTVPQYRISYARYVAGDYAIVQTILPASRLATEADAVAWGRTMVEQTRGLVEGTPQSLPELPGMLP